MNHDKKEYAKSLRGRHNSSYNKDGNYKPTIATDVIDYAIYTLHYNNSRDMVHAIARDVFVFKGIHERAGFENLNLSEFAMHSVFIQAVRQQNYDLLDYIFDHAELIKLSKIGLEKSEWFDTLCYGYTLGNPEFLQWLIFEKNLEYKAQIKVIANKGKYHAIKDLFEIRELNKKLSEKLAPKNKAKPSKI